MQRGRKIGVGIAVGAVALVGLHYGYWWLGTNEIKKQLAFHSANMQKDGNSFTYEATAAGYPFTQRVDLSHIALRVVNKEKAASLALDIANGVSLNAGGGLTGNLNIAAHDMPLTLKLERGEGVPGKTPFIMDFQGKLGDGEIISPLARLGNTPQTTTSRFKMLELWSAARPVNKMVLPEMTHTTTYDPAQEGSFVSHGEIKQMSFSQVNVVKGQNLTGNATMGSMTLDMAIDKVSSTSPVLRQFDLKIANLAGADQVIDPATGKVELKQTQLSEMGFGISGEPHDAMIDLLLTLKLANLKVTGPTASPVGDVKEFTCALAYKNFPDFGAMLPAAEGAETDDAAHTKAFAEMVVKNQSSLGIDNCRLDSAAVSGSLVALAKVGADGYPEITARLAASGTGIQQLNALRGIMMPQPGADPMAAPADTMDVKLETVDHMLAMDGKPFFPLPEIRQLVAMHEASEAQKAALAAPAAAPSSTEVK